MIYIVGGKILTMAGDSWEKGYLCIEDGKIREVGPMENGAPFPLPEGENVTIINACGYLVMPGLIEAHCHMGIMEEKMGMEGDDCNEAVNPITPYLRAIDAINPMDAAFESARRAGITSAMIGPGSANVVGGTFCFVKNFGRCIDEMLLLSPAAMKIAFGENPKVNYADLDKSPVTRMGIAAMLREELFKAQRYYEKKCAGMKREEEDFRLEAWIPVFEKKIPLKAHVHRTDDIQTAIRIAGEFGVDVTLDHCSEGHLIAEKIKESGFPAIIGPGLASRSKIEVQNKAFKTVGILNRAGVKTAITTDHPVTPIQTLPICAGLAVKAGMDEMEALKSITIYPAQICRVDQRVGTLELGKDADIAIFDGLPLKLETRVMCTMIGGRIVYADESFSLPACEKKV